MAVGKKITDLTASGSLKDTDLAIVHDGNGTKKSTLTQLGEYMGTKFSNPNLLINPDFKINRRGKSEYTSNSYTVDRWKINSGSVKPSSSGVTVTLNNKGQFIQAFENLLTGTYTASIKITSITGECALFVGQHSLQLNKAGVFSFTENGSMNGVSLYKSTAGTCTINIEWIKLEQGSIATPFIAPNSAEELEKCKAFYLMLPKSLVGYRLANGVLIGVNDIAKMKRAKTATVVGNNKNTQLVCNGNTANAVITSVEILDGNVIGLYIQNVQSIFNHQTIALDFNDSQLAIDAEIY